MLALNSKVVDNTHKHTHTHTHTQTPLKYAGKVHTPQNLFKTLYHLHHAKHYIF